VAHGEQNGNSKLRRAQADEIRFRHAAGASRETLAEQFKVSTTNVSLITGFRTWTSEGHVTRVPAKQPRAGAYVRGEANHRAKLSASDVAQIRARYAEGERAGAIARACGISRSHVWRLATGGCWRPSADDPTRLRLVSQHGAILADGGRPLHISVPL
jgi:hypothetical protein